MVVIMDKTEETKIQAARASLRVKFLKVITGLVGKQSTIETYENSVVSGKVLAFDPSFRNVIIEDLKTPVPPTIPKAILRTDDIITMEFTLN